MAGANPIIAVTLMTKSLTLPRALARPMSSTPVAKIRGAIHSLTTRDDGFNLGRAPISGADYALTVGIKQTMEQIVPACHPAVISVPMGAKQYRQESHHQGWRSMQ